MRAQRSRLHNRREFLVASSCGVAGFSFGFATPERAPANPAPTVTSNYTKPATAKSVILFFLCGGASHVDTWDMKPNAPSEYRGPFAAMSTSAPEIQLCEHLPLLAKQAHHLAIIRSVGATVNTNDHHAGYYYHLTGHVPDPTFLSLGNDRRPYADDWPFLGSVIAQRSPNNPNLPNAITLPHKPSKLPYTRPGQFAARIGVEFDPMYVDGSNETPLKFQAPSLVLAGDISAAQLQSRHELLGRLNQARKEMDTTEPSTASWKRHQERTLNLLLSPKTTNAFDLTDESTSLREDYGSTVNATSLLMARRLVEAGVPFITVFWKENEAIADRCKSEGAWDTHGNNFGCLKEHLLPEFDKAFAALMKDLENRGLLDQTLLVVNSEMGRKPKIGDPRSGGPNGAGRDHWTHCQSVLMAGGGIRGGQTFGASDRLGEYPSDHPVTPADITKTIYHAMGIDDLQARDAIGRPYNLLEEGKPIQSLF